MIFGRRSEPLDLYMYALSTYGGEAPADDIRHPSIILALSVDFVKDQPQIWNATVQNSSWVQH